MNGPWLCPECRAGKHRACIDDALNEDTDEIVECECRTCPTLEDRWTLEDR